MGGNNYPQKFHELRHHGKEEPVELNDSDSEWSTDTQGQYFHLIKRKNKYWKRNHSLERIIKDIFEDDRLDLLAKLLELFAKKRAEKAAIEIQGQNQISCSSSGKKGRKQKQRNKKKGKGKRGMTVAQVEGDSN